MRIIAGEFRGRRLLPPAGEATRPITDRVKQSLFDILAPRLDGAIVYDCFAGTGSMGLESLSRGAERALFFETDRTALARLQQNIDALGVADRARIVRGDLFRWFNSHDAPPDENADVVFLDPPYRFLREQAPQLQALAKRVAEAHLADDGHVIFRHDAKDELSLPPLTVVDRREYGGMTLEWLSRPSQSAPATSES